MFFLLITTAFTPKQSILVSKYKIKILYKLTFFFFKVIDRQGGDATMTESQAYKEIKYRFAAIIMEELLNKTTKTIWLRYKMKLIANINQ
ncbi:MAG: hypothetical protein BWY97_01272 [Tenericutes bacterium ADurb.BinA124]|nr:MAG: hypothetical protein BWY97_01272 [Tenericutes bacterium ADurb.BinA124]